jgi:hypothetical protein
MKQIITLLAGAAILLAINGCDSVTTDFDTNLNKTILAEVAEVKSGTKDAVTYPFNATDVLDIRDNSKINDYFDRLKEINVNSIACTFTGIPSGETVTELTISIPSAGLGITLTDLDNATQVTLDVSPQILDAISKRLIETHEITIGISGRSTYAPMTLSTLMSFAVTVKARVLD